jgi:ABC-type multidrug transport system fused ATPase/permease subunit
MILWWVRILNDFEINGAYTLSHRCSPVSNEMIFRQQVKFLKQISYYIELTQNSLERIQGYITVEQEPKPTEQGKPPAYWPASGDIRVEHLSARYSLVSPCVDRISPPTNSFQDGPKVLNDLSFHIKSGERVGVGEYIPFNALFCGSQAW